MQKIKSKIYNLLRWSQKYTQTDMVYLVEGGFWLTFGKIVSTIASFLLTIAFANLLSKEIYGIYKYILSLAGLLTIFTLSGINTAVIQAVARGYEGTFVSALKTKIKWGLFGGLISIVLAGYYYFHGDIALTLCFLVAAAFLPFMDSLAIYSSLLTGRKLFKFSTKYDIITQVIAAAIMMVTLFLTNNIFLVIFAYFVPNTLLRLIFLKITLKKFQPNEKKDPKTISYGKHLSLMGVFDAIASQIDKILIFHYLGAIELAIYSFAVVPIDQIKGLFKNIHLLALPKFSQRTIEEIKQGILKKMLKFGLVISVITIIYILVAPLVFKIFFPQYLESISYSQIYAISLIATIVMLPIAALQSISAKKELYQLNIYSSIIQIIVLFLFIYFYGLWGAIIARVIARFIGLGLASSLLKKTK
ncbi:oligosaccharide flippase family protein [Patescibacteria group bacterium]|nr:oligosaccharide flippase family protein [Patescibacteria group bacterium]MBU4458362.1 oligosaccharide flippase family protein [Patescibacteria group bacterium]MCG2695883.1 oligosaccharide flippase family protein [Candidatus Portnoybacteria bacterium]